MPLPLHHLTAATHREAELASTVGVFFKRKFWL